MRYRVLGGTGIEVSAYCFGAMMLGHEANSDRDEGVRMIHAALDRGINFVDTADAYSDGDSEEIVGAALAGRRDDVELADELGCSLPALAVAFPLAHPAVSSVILGPRTMIQLQQLLDGAALSLDDAALDRIDAIAAPGTDHYTTAWRPPWLDAAASRRRPSADRAAL